MLQIEGMEGLDWKWTVKGGRLKSKYIVETMVEGRKVFGALRKLANEISEIFQMEMSKNVG
jgi:hypothetical protein